MPMLTMAQALNTALRDSLAADDNVVVFGEAELGAPAQQAGQSPSCLNHPS